MIKLKAACATCDVIKAELLELKSIEPKDSPLVKLIHKSQLKLVPLTYVASSYPHLNYASLANHAKKHQAPTNGELVKSRGKELVKASTRELSKRQVTTELARQEVTDRLYAELEQVDMTQMKPKDVIDLLLKATKITDDVAAKKTDQSVDILRVMAGIRSGELPENKHHEQFKPFDPWDKKDVLEGEIIPSSEEIVEE